MGQRPTQKGWWDMVVWGKLERDCWSATVGDKTLYVRRTVVRHRWAYDPPFVCIGRKPQRYSSTTLVHAVVVKTCFSVRVAKAAAVRLAVEGVGALESVVVLDSAGNEGN